MRGLEGERVTPQKYILQWVKESTGIGRAQREMKMRKIDGFLGISQFMSPSLSQVEESRREKHITKLNNFKEIFRTSSAAVLDIGVMTSLIILDYNGHLLDGVIIKFGYNFVSQIAPDVAKLATKTALKLKGVK
jgi:hypothetical protein